MSQAIVQTYTFVRDYRRIFMIACIFICFSLLVWYSVNLVRVIVLSSELKTTERSISLISDEIGKLDSAYLEISRSVTSDKLVQFGLSRTEVSVFIPRNVSLGSVSLSGYDI